MRSVVTSSAVVVYLLAGHALAQTAAPSPPPAKPPGAASAAPAAPTTSETAPNAEPPESDVLKVLEERLRRMQNGQGLTADEAARRAVATSSQIEAKRYAVASTEAAISQTEYAFWPQLRLSAGYTRLSHRYVHLPPGTPPAQTAQVQLFAPDIPNNYNLNARLNVPLSDYVLRLSDAVRAAQHSRSAAQAETDAMRASVARDARVAYYQWVRAQARELIALAALEQARLRRTDAGNAFEAGLVSKADVMRAESGVKNAELFAERARNGVALATLALRVSMHDAEGATYEVGEDVLEEAPELLHLPTIEGAYREALANRAELKSLGALGEALRDQARTEQVRAYPRLDASAGATYARPNQLHFPPADEFHGNWDAGVVLSWTPTDIGGAGAAANVAEAKAREFDAQAMALRDGLRLEVEQAIRSGEEARFAITVTHQGLEAAKESYRVRRELYRAGRATLTELTDAEANLTQARLQTADAHVDARVALAELRHALGRDQAELARRPKAVAPTP